MADAFLSEGVDGATDSRAERAAKEPEGLMHIADQERIALAAVKKWRLLDQSVPRYVVLSAFAGAELFTGDNRVGAIAGLSKSLSWNQVIQLNFGCWLGNLLGSMGIAWLVVQSGVLSKPPFTDLIEKMASIVEMKQSQGEAVHGQR